MSDSDDIARKIEAFLEPRGLKIFLVLLGCGLLLAWANHFVQDDAFISFIYARSLAHGQGLTWFGTRVEGYTNFLWVLWLALGIRLGIDPIYWSYLGGMTSFALMVFGAWKAAQIIFKKTFPALLSVLLLITNYSVLAYATGGLETMVQTALLILSFYYLLKNMEREQVNTLACLYLSLLLAASVLTRMDSCLPGLIIGCYALLHLFQKRARVKNYLMLCLPFAIIVGAWLIWKVHYYGRIFPNTYYAKVGLDPAFVNNGMIYVYRFFHWYLIWPFIVAGAGVLIVKGEKAAAFKSLAPAVYIVLSWVGYVCLVGGDFMEFRFLIPVTPFLFIVLTYLIYYQLGEKMLRDPALVSALSVAILAGASIYHGVNFDREKDLAKLDSVTELSTFFGKYPQHNWDRIGKKLRSDLPANTVITVDAAGAIPYYSGFKTVDGWGLNDLNIPHEGIKPPRLFILPGHRRHATLSYLKQQKVNLVIGDPTIIKSSALSDARFASSLISWVRDSAVRFSTESFGEVSIVAMPLDNDESLLMLYLTPDKNLTAGMMKNAWEMLKIKVPDVAGPLPLSGT